MKYIIITLSLVPLLFYSCDPREKRDEEPNAQTQLPPEERAEKALQDEVIAIHDEVMPKMDELMRLKERLLTKLDSLQNIEAEEEQLNELRKDVNQLQKADSAMMNWMRQFKAIRDTISHEQRIQYLKDEKARIEKVREMMLNALEDARKSV